LNIYGNAVVDVDHNLIVGADNGASGYLNVYGSGKLNIAGDANVSVGGYSGTRQVNISNGGSVTVGGNLNVGSGIIGTVNVTGAGNLTVSGTTTLAGGSTVTLDSTGILSLKAVTGGATDTLVVGDSSGTYLATATADSVTVGTLTIGAGSTLTINALSGGPSSGGALTAVPEPSTFVLLAIAALGLVGAAWRRRNR
jgi:hypothetical protein